MPDANQSKCDVCGERPASIFMTEIVNGVMNKSNLCEDCAPVNLSPRVLAIHEAMKKGCSYCGAPATGGGLNPLQTPTAQCKSCSAASRDYMLSVYGLSPDEPESIYMIPVILKQMSPEAKAEATRKMAGIEDYLRGRRVRYDPEGYAFVQSVVGIQTGHVTAAILLDVLRFSALKKFGANARAQLRQWGITRCEDFGEIVFRLVEEGLLSAEPGESREDFGGGYDFETAFPIAE